MAEPKGGNPSRGTRADRRRSPAQRAAERAAFRKRKPSRKEVEGHQQTDPGQAAARRTRTQARTGQPRRGSK